MTTKFLIYLCGLDNLPHHGFRLPYCPSKTAHAQLTGNAAPAFALLNGIQRIKPYIQRIIPLLLVADEQPKIRFHVVQMLDHARQGGEAEQRGGNEAVVAFTDQSLLCSKVASIGQVGEGAE